MSSSGGDGLAALMGSQSSSMGSGAGVSPTGAAVPVGMLANNPPGNIPNQPQTPQNLGLDSESQQALGWQPLGVK